MVEENFVILSLKWNASQNKQIGDDRPVEEGLGNPLHTPAPPHAQIGHYDKKF